MANLGGLKVEEIKYESESEESVCAVATLRENASDDDDDNGNGEGEARERLVRSGRGFRVGYGYESDGLGGCDDDDAVSCFDELEVLEDEQVEVFKEEEEVEDDFGENNFEERSYKKEVQAEVKQRQQEESEAPVDPRNGAFYMHDDRFRGRGRGSSRWTLDESFRAVIDERKWMHDKFEQMKVQETYDNKFNAFAKVRRISDHSHRGHPKNQGKGQVYVKENWPKSHDNINNQNYSANVVRGRGPIKYNPIMRSNNVNLPTKAKLSMRTQGQASNTSSRRVFSTKDVHYSKPLEIRLTLESARTFSTKKKSERFEKEASRTASVRKNDVQCGKAFGYLPTSALPNHNSFLPHYNSLLQGRIANNPIVRDRFYAENFIHPASESYLTNLPPQSSIAWLTHQLLPTTNQVSSVYPLAQQPIVQQIPDESTIQHPSLVFTQQLNQSSGSGVQASSEACLPNYYETGTLGSLPTSSKSKAVLGGKGISTLRGNGKGSILSAETQSNQNFKENAVLFPAMGHGGQHNCDLGEPAVNRAVSRYLSQPQNASRNPEITWFPVFPAADGTVCSAYHSPWVPSKGGYTAYSTEKSSSYRVTRYSRMNIDKQSQ